MGGTTPVTGSHNTIDRPEPVSRVAPPLTTRAKSTRQHTTSHTPEAVSRVAPPSMIREKSTRQQTSSHMPTRRRWCVSIRFIVQSLLIRLPAAQRGRQPHGKSAQPVAAVYRPRDPRIRAKGGGASRHEKRIIDASRPWPVKQRVKTQARKAIKIGVQAVCTQTAFDKFVPKE